MLVHFNFLAVIPRGRELQKLVARYEKVCGPEADLYAGMFRLFKGKRPGYSKAKATLLIYY